MHWIQFYAKMKNTAARDFLTGYRFYQASGSYDNQETEDMGEQIHEYIHDRD